jgi:hypothetical protein
MQNVKIRFAYRKGFRRLWLILSVIWLLGTLAVVYDYRDDAVQSFLVAGLLPVAALYLIGAALVWIIEGFAKPDL